MYFRHKHFLTWLLYATVMAFVWISGFYVGIPQMALSFDTTYMCAGLMLVYLLTEVYLGSLAWRTSSAIESKRRLPKLGDLETDGLYKRNEFGYFVGDTVLLVGLFGTVYGIIRSFQPFFGMHGFDTATLQNHMGDFFTGLAVAFFPSAVSIAVKAMLDVSSRILTNAADGLVEARNK